MSPANREMIPLVVITEHCDSDDVCMYDIANIFRHSNMSDSVYGFRNGWTCGYIDMIEITVTGFCV